MEQTNNSNVEASVVIPSVRIPIEPISNVIDWFGVFDAVALNVQKYSKHYMVFENISALGANKRYSIYVTNNVCPTKDERRKFVQRMMNDSNFAKGDRIKFILYVKGTKIPFGVVVEDY